MSDISTSEVSDDQCETGSDESEDEGSQSSSESEDEEDEEGDEMEADATPENMNSLKDDGDCPGTASLSDGEGEVCPVCLNHFVGQELGTPESCNHTFCLECIVEWSKNLNSCPLDRTEFNYILVKLAALGEVLKKVKVKVRPKEAENALPEDTTTCEVCQQGDREERLLLCDSCDLAYHCECLTPPLRSIPIQEWFCPPCSAILNKTPKRSSNRNTGRVIPRTMVSEAVRMRIQSQRTVDADTVSVGPISRPSTSRGTTQRPKRRRKYRRRKTTRREPVLARTKKTVMSFGKGKTRVRTPTTRRVRRRRTRRRRKVSKAKKTTTRTTRSRFASRPLAAPSAKDRIANHLGLCKPPPGHTIPCVKGGSSKKQEGSSTTLSLFGNHNQLMDFAEDSENECIAGPSSFTPRRNGGPIQCPISSVDVLGNIFSAQNMLQKSSKEITIGRDGSLSLKVSEEKQRPPKYRSENHILKEKNRSVRFDDSESNSGDLVSKSKIKSEPTNSSDIKSSHVAIKQEVVNNSQDVKLSPSHRLNHDSVDLDVKQDIILKNVKEVECSIEITKKGLIKSENEDELGKDGHRHLLEGSRRSRISSDDTSTDVCNRNGTFKTQNMRSSNLSGNKRSASDSNQLPVDSQTYNDPATNPWLGFLVPYHTIATKAATDHDLEIVAVKKKKMCFFKKEEPKSPDSNEPALLSDVEIVGEVTSVMEPCEDRFNSPEDTGDHKEPEEGEIAILEFESTGSQISDPGTSQKDNAKIPSTKSKVPVKGEVVLPEKDAPSNHGKPPRNNPANSKRFDVGTSVENRAVSQEVEKHSPVVEENRTEQSSQPFSPANLHNDRTKSTLSRLRGSNSNPNHKIHPPKNVSIPQYPPKLNFKIPKLSGSKKNGDSSIVRGGSIFDRADVSPSVDNNLTLKPHTTGHTSLNGFHKTASKISIKRESQDKKPPLHIVKKKNGKALTISGDSFQRNTLVDIKMEVSDECTDVESSVNGKIDEIKTSVNIKLESDHHQYEMALKKKVTRVKEERSDNAHQFSLLQVKTEKGCDITKKEHSHSNNNHRKRKADSDLMDTFAKTVSSDEGAMAKKSTSDKKPTKDEAVLLTYVESVVKQILKPFYVKKDLSKENYKEIMRRSVPKIVKNSPSGVIDTNKVKALVLKYVSMFVKDLTVS